MRRSPADRGPGGEPAGRVSLDRLLSVAVLSPAQAALVAVQLLDAIARAGTTNGAKPGRRRLWAVALTPSGEVEVSPCTGRRGCTGHRAPRAAEPERPPAPGPPEARAARAAAQAGGGRRGAAPEPGARARELEERAGRGLGSGARQRLAGQLAALVDAFAHIAASVRVPVAALAASRWPATRSAPGRADPPRPSDRPSGARAQAEPSTRRTRRTALVALFLAVALAGSGYVVLRDPGTGRGGTRAHDDDPAAAAADAPSGSSEAARDTTAVPPPARRRRARGARQRRPGHRCRGAEGRQLHAGGALPRHGHGAPPPRRDHPARGLEGGGGAVVPQRHHLVPAGHRDRPARLDHRLRQLVGPRPAGPLARARRPDDRTGPGPVTTGAGHRFVAALLVRPCSASNEDCWAAAGPARGPAGRRSSRSPPSSIPSPSARSPSWPVSGWPTSQHSATGR